MKRKPFVLIAIVSMALAGNVSANQIREWSRIIGVTNYDSYGSAVAADQSGGNVFIAGYTDATNFDGRTNNGGQDVCLISWTSNGTKQWTRLIGSNQNEYAQALIVDRLTNLFIAGYTYGAWGQGQTNTGAADLFLTKVLPTGSQVTNWVWGSVSNDYAGGVAIDTNDNIYVSGTTEGAFGGQTNQGELDLCLTKFFPGGSQAWSKVWGSTSNEYGGYVAVDSSANSYVVGYTYGAFGGESNTGSSDICLTKFNAAGSSLWTRIWGSTISDYGEGVAVDTAGAIYVAGYTFGSFDGETNAGSEDVFLTKYAPNGNKQWTRIWGSPGFDCGMGVAVDGTNNVFVAGYTEGSFHGQTNNGGIDIFLTGWDANGSNSVSIIWGSPTNESGAAVTFNSLTSNIYVTGYTMGSFDGEAQSNPTYNDIFLSKFDQTVTPGINAPTGVSASDGTYIDKVRLAWLSTTNTTGYQIWRNTSSDSATAGLLGSSTSTEYDDSGAGVGILYYYWVKATNSSAVSVFSASDTGWRALSVPTGVSASDGTYVDKVQVTWNAVTGAMSYCVWRNTSNSTSTATQIVETSSVSYDDTSVILQVTYYYWVQAKNSLGISGFSSSDTGYVAQAYGFVAVDVTPDSGTWTFTSYPSDYTGPISGTGDLSSQAAPVGSYTIKFGALTGYVTPASATGTVTTNATTTFSATYAALDTDNDGLTDLDEVNVYGTDPYNPDTDGDSYLDGEEVSAGKDPLDPNSYLSGTLSLTAPTTGTVAKKGKSLTVSWTGDSALGTADIYLAKGTSFWDLAIGVSCPASSMSGSVPLPTDLDPATNYHVKVQGTGSVLEFGESAMFTIIRECHGDYDGDGKADLCLYYPPWGMWFVLRSTKGFWYQQFGWDGPTPIPADYDGDGLTDLAVYDPDTGTWYVLTWTWNFYTLQFGSSDTEPVPADYDGDGWIDFAVYYPAQGYWYILTWAGQYFSRRFGWSETVPVPGDYDGDGTSDLAVYYEAGGTWYLLKSTDGFSTEVLGGSGMEAVPDDYDGDGTTDLAVYDSQAGTWYFNMSSQGYLSVQFGWEEPTPVSGDYDGDGKADIGLVYGPLGLWYLLMSTDGYAYKLFGWDGPIPLD